MNSLTIWIKCPKVGCHRGIKYCRKCDSFAGIGDDVLLCLEEGKKKEEKR